MSPRGPVSVRAAFLVGLLIYVGVVVLLVMLRAQRWAALPGVVH